MPKSSEVKVYENLCRESLNHNKISTNKRQIVIENNKIDSKTLFGKEQIFDINHNNEEYHLRITSNNKLILTK